MQENDFTRDSGLQPERTGLAWSRTGLLALLIAALSFRIGVSASAIAHLVVALLLASLACATLYWGHNRSLYKEQKPVVTGISQKLFAATSAVIVLVSAIQAALMLIRLMK